MCERIIVI